MKKVLIGALAAFVLFVAGVLAYAATLPDEWRVEESTVVEAEPAEVYATVSNLRSWNDWTVWGEERDPTLENTYDGPERGEGAVWKWSGEEMGNGRMEITEAKPAEFVKYELTFVDMDSTSYGTISLEPVEQGTRVTWVDGGSMGYIGRLMTPMIEESIAGEFAKSLERLKAKEASDQGTS